MSGETLHSRTQRAPKEYKEARYAYIDRLLVRIHEEWSEGDLKRLKIMYVPIVEQIKKELGRHFQRANADDLENCINSRFLHLVWKYDPLATQKMSFSMWLKNYLKGWCYRFMNDLMGTSGNSKEKREEKRLVLSSDIRGDDADSGYIEIVGASEDNTVEDAHDAKIVIKRGVENIRAFNGDKAADAFAMKYLYEMTQNEIADVLGCTQAKVSKILVEAEKHFRRGVNREKFMSVKYLRTTMEKAKGFMGRDHVADDEAMLFIDVREGSSFHMRTVKMPLGIAALDSSFVVIDKEIMDAEHGGYSTPTGTAHVLEFSPKIIDKIIIGKEPDWSGLFNEDGPSSDMMISEYGEKIIASLNPQAEMVKEITTISLNEDDEPDVEAAHFVGYLMGDDFRITDYNREMLKFEPSGGTADAEYYGEPQLSESLDASSVAYNALNAVFGSKMVHQKDRVIYLKRAALKKSVNSKQLLKSARIQVV